MNDVRPRVGVGVIVRNGKMVLLGLRKGAHGVGSWSFPGGHLEHGEDIASCAVREVMEETGAHISVVRFGPYTNDIFTAEDKHYVTLFVIADYAAGEIHAMEPEKCDRWEWHEWGALPRPLFLPIHNLLKSGFDPFL
jgi:8-oxo-dGTP diphosphatase